MRMEIFATLMNSWKQCYRTALVTKVNIRNFRNDVVLELDVRGSLKEKKKKIQREEIWKNLFLLNYVSNGYFIRER